jgi:DNA polymerase-3 subunit epsilon
MDDDHERATQWARSLLERNDWVVLDTETTGLSYNDEIVQIAILASDGSVLLDSLVRPIIPINPEATNIHGITNEKVADAPPFSEIYEKIKSILSGKSIVIYNAAFDIRLLQQTMRKYQLPRLKFEEELIECAMLYYAAWRGEIWANGSYKWQKLQGGDHSAVGDCRATLELIKRMAE